MTWREASRREPRSWPISPNFLCLSTFCGVDEIWVMDQGVLVERNTHDSLIAQDGVYAKLVRLQFSKSEAA